MWSLARAATESQTELLNQESPAVRLSHGLKPPSQGDTKHSESHTAFWESAHVNTAPSDRPETQSSQRPHTGQAGGESALADLSASSVPRHRAGGLRVGESMSVQQETSPHRTMGTGSEAASSECWGAPCTTGAPLLLSPALQGRTAPGHSSSGNSVAISVQRLLWRKPAAS